MKPLISCIMPVRNRPQYIAGAMACFQAQTWPNRELVVVDNSDQPVSSALPSWAQYDYVGSEKRTVGWMRNRACEVAQGDFIAHFDSDDWSHPNRLTEQWKMCISYEAAIVGYRNMPFIDEENKEAWMYLGQPSYALGTSFFYPRAFWKSTKFADISVGEDGEILQRSGGALSTDGSARMVARIHADNTSPKRGIIAESDFWKPMNYEQVAAMML